MSADLQRVIEIVFSGTDNLGPTLHSISRNLDGFQASVGNVSEPVADFSQSLLTAEAAVATFATGVGVAGFNAAAKFEGAALDLKKVLDDTDSLETYTELATELGLEYGVASDAVLQSITNFKQAGFTAEEAGQLTRNGLDLVIAGGMEAGQAADLLVASIRGFGAEASDAAPIIDLLNQVSNEYSATLPELIKGFSEISPVAKAAGLSFEETAGLLTPGIEVFRSGSEVATALKTSLLNLQSDSGSVRDALESLGVSQRDVNGELRTAGDIYFDVAQAFQGLDESQKTYLAAQLVGLDQSARFIAVTEGLGTTLKIAGDDFKYTGSAAGEVEIRLQSAEVAVDRLGVAFDNILVKIGNEFIGESTKAINSTTQLETVLAGLIEDGAFEKLFDVARDALSSFETTIDSISNNLPAVMKDVDLDGLVASLKNMGDAFDQLFDGVDLSTPEGLKDAVQFAVDALEALTNISASTVRGLEPFIDTLTAIVQKTVDADTETENFAGEVLGLVTGINSLLPVAGGLSNTLGTLADVLILMAGARGFAGVASSIGSVVPLLTNPVTGVLAGFGLLVAYGDDIADLALEMLGVKTSAEELAQAQKEHTEWTENATAALNGNKEALEKADDATRALYEAKKDAEGIDERLSEAARWAALSYEEQIAILERKSEAQKNLNEINGTASERDKARAQDQEALKEKTLALAASFDDMTRAQYEALDADERKEISDARALARKNGWLDALKKEEEATKKQAETIKDEIALRKQASDELFRHTQQTLDYQLALEQLASDERLKTMEFSFQLNLEALRGDIEIGKSIIETLDSTINSTAQLIGELFGQLDGLSNYSDRKAARDMIEDENRRREEALQQQKELTAAQIEGIDAQARYYRERAAAVAAGGATIQVEAAGLTPALELMFDEVLRHVHVRASEEGADFLLGL